MAQWKYTNQYTNQRGQFLRFKDGEEKTLVLSNWSFDRSTAGYLFKCYVEKENGESVDMIWCVWDYESTERLRKKLKAKYLSGTKEVKVKMQLNEDGEPEFTIQ